ncbi:hypothetical protein [Pseudomonas sp. BF-RE-24]|uniref:hypothetical protein n=1 Tax=Pseudomonas sp. BF-RE-24 TaxID=2832381 RepID=UPI001CC07AFF|nr:hypothetical protein [Pseudomonas sp. BF-RE-24]
MKAASLSISKVEFIHVRVESNSDYEGEHSSEFHQLDFSFDGVNFKRRMSLQYDKAKSEDPRTFIFGLSIMLEEDENDSDSKPLPYDIDIKAVVYMKYMSDHLTGMERFRAIRATGYSILYGAIREMVSNLTARGPNGMWSLPSADFNSASGEEAIVDEKRRQEYLAKQAISSDKKVVKRPKKKPEV